MVFCGKPSLACGECRLRRTKCDTKRPSCSQCIRSGRTCRGYRDPGELMFRDESQNLKAKRKRASNNAQTKEVPPDQTVWRAAKIVPAEPSLAILPTPPALTFNGMLGPSAEDQATSFFFHNYVLAQDPTRSCFKGGFQFLHGLYHHEVIEPALADSISALGMVGLAHFWKSSNIMANATFKYHGALRALSSKLRIAEEAKKDQTIVAVMMLGLYETNTCNDRQAMEAWTKHICGAVTLLQLRGKKQLRTPIGYHLFVHLRTQIITNCMQRHAAVPPIFLEWTSELEFETPEQAAGTRLSNLTIRYCNLRASMSSFEDYSKSDYVITTACALDIEYANWANTSPIQYIYETVLLKEPNPDVFSDYYHRYSTIWIATIWNHYRCLRILINELIITQLQHYIKQGTEDALLRNDTDLLEAKILESGAVALQQSQDICASVPFFLDFDPNSEPSSRKLPKSVNGNLLIWPLYTAGVTQTVSDIMRSWVTDRLQWIADFLGIRQAGPMAFTLRKRQDIFEWQLEGREISELSSKLIQPPEVDLGRAEHSMLEACVT